MNDRCVDRNYGGILILWDRLFGTFEDEDAAEPVVYGTRAPLRSFNPLWANLEVYAGLARDAWHARHGMDKLRVWLKPPGWRPADVAARFPKPPFRIERRRRFDPAVPDAALWLAALAFTAVFLWTAHQLAPWSLAGGALLVWALLAVSGALLQGQRAEPLSEQPA